MAVCQGISLAVLVSFAAFSSVHSQTDVSFITPTEMALRANLTKLVQYVVHPSAEPSMDLINYALVAGGAPKTQAERMAYLDLMKKIARGIPELVKQFTTTTTLPGGIKSETLDESGLDARITMRAMQYVQKQKEEAALAQSTANTAASSSSTVNNASDSNAVVNTAVSSTATGLNEAMDTGSILTANTFYDSPLVPAATTNIPNNMFGMAPQPVTVQDLQQDKLIPAADGTVSLEDVFRFINSYNQQNPANTQQLI